MEVKDLEEIGGRVSFFFSALPSEVALEVEGRVAREKPVVSTASAFRYFEDSFTYLPSVNESQAPPDRGAEEEEGVEGLRGAPAQLHHHRAGPLP